MDAYVFNLIIQNSSRSCNIFLFESGFLLKYCSNHLVVELVLLFLELLTVIFASWPLALMISSIRVCIFVFFGGVSDQSRHNGLFCPAEVLESSRRADLTDWQFFLWRDKLWRFPSLFHTSNTWFHVRQCHQQIKYLSCPLVYIYSFPVVACYHFIAVLLPFCYHFINTLLPFWYHFGNMLPLCYHFVTILLQFLITCYHFVTILIPFW